jgi:DeoR family transcriptional regulator, aga operon transcriptional repressor
MARSTLRRADRVSTILDRISSDGSVDARALAKEFAVSVATIRRDLQTLEDQKLLNRTHGGAIAAEVSYELPVRYRVGQHREEKLAIARTAVSRLPHGPLTVGLTGGTTTHAVARLLADRFDLAVVTNALNIAAELALRPRLKLVMTGGVSRTQSYELVGPIADRTLGGLNIEVAIVGVDGISARAGLTTHDDIEANTNATMIRQAQRVIVVADGSKVGRVHLARICALQDIDEFVTDASADPAVLAAISAAGVTVTVATSDSR